MVRLKATSETGTVGWQGAELVIKDGFVNVPAEAVEALTQFFGFEVAPAEEKEKGKKAYGRG